MGYRVIYLDGEEGRPKKTCKICEELERNVIEPVAIFLPEDKNLSDLTDEELENFDTCIFHCEKENEIWMKNLEEHKEWKKRRDKANAKGEKFNEDFKIEWEENLVNEFWSRIRAYRFAVDHSEQWRKASRNWDNFINAFSDNQELFNQIQSVQRLIEFYLSALNNPNLHDFRFFLFPYFPELIFWYKSEKKEFLKKANFSEAQFHQLADFIEAQFHQLADFSRAQFHQLAYFIETQFHQLAYFNETQFHQLAYFIVAQFHQLAYFSVAQFHQLADFSVAQFHLLAYLSSTSFKKSATFNLEGRTFAFIFNPELTEESHIEVRNLNAYKLEIEDFTNISRNLLFFDCSIIVKKEYIEEQLSLFKERIKEIKSISESALSEILTKLDEIDPSSRQVAEKLEETVKEIIEDITHKEAEIQLLKFAELFITNIAVAENKKDEPNLVINNSILGKLRLINCDFSKAEKIKIENSELTGVKFANVNWGEVSEKRICPELFRNKPEKARDVYRQLKLAHDNQKDHITANEFYALEMKAYERVLRKKSWFNPKYFQQKLVFALHKFVSNFGQSWLRPLILIFLITITNIGAQTNPKLFFNYLLYFALILFSSALIYQLILAPPQFIEILKTIIFSFSKRKNLSNNDLYGLGLDGILWGITTLSALAGFLTFLESAKWTVSPLDFLEVFASSLNIFKLFGSFSQTLEVENSTNFLEFHISSRFLHTVYAIIVTFLIYQIIVAVRRQVRR